MSGHRKPPLPASMKARATPGVCRWCALPVEGKRTWHPECVTAYKLLHWPASTRRAVFERDHGFCARCGCDAEKVRRMWIDLGHLWSRLARMHFEAEVSEGRLKIQAWGECHHMAREAVAERMKREGAPNTSVAAWQHDHIRPLIEANGDLSYWQLDNIQTLCHRCHVEKGKEDNRRRKLAREPQEVLAL